jgi:branched-chain amino acid transport system ATP-binding protein
MSGNVLELSNVTSGYGDLTVVREVSLTVAPATITAVLGRNGAGKTTTLNTIAGLLPTKSGQITFEDAPITNAPAHVRRRIGFGYVQENKRVFKQRSVEENLLLGMHRLGLNRTEERKRIEESYARFPVLAEKRKQVAGFLSGGQQQMLAIAQALLNRPKLLMLDEPSTGLAPSIVSEVMETVRALRDDEGRAVLLIEQAVETALSVADSVVVLDVGRVVHTARADEPGLRKVIENAYMAAPAED